MNLYDYQQTAVNQAMEKLDRYGLVYLAMEMRTGKTPVSLSIAKQVGGKALVIYPNKDTAHSFQEWAQKLSIDIELSSNHPATLAKFKKKNYYACIIIDEAHNFKAFPKPSLRAKQLREIVKLNPTAKIILLSATPNPESISDLYHQFWAVGKETHKNFYAFARDFVRVKEKYVAGGNSVVDYSDCKEEYLNLLNHYYIRISQNQAGINTQKIERTLKVRMPNSEQIAQRIINHQDTGIKGITIDSIAREMMALRQISGGFIYNDNQEGIEIDTGKIEALKLLMNRYKKGLIFYYFQYEKYLLQRYLKEMITEDLNEAKETDKWLIAQLMSKREGITFAEADVIVYYSVDFSAVTYFQSRERLTIKGKEIVEIIYLFSSTGFDEIVYRNLLKKKRFTEKAYQRERKKFLKKC